MPDNIATIVLSSLFFGIFALAMVRVLIKGVKSRYSPVKTVRATVVDKQTIESFSKYAGDGKQEKFVVVFSLGEKKKSFYVSRFSYDGYRIGEKGLLNIRETDS